MNKTTERTATVWPTLTYRDARAAIRFLVDAFGFEEVVSYPGTDESIVSHAELRWPAGGGVMLGTARADSVIADLPPGTGSVYVVTEDPDGLFERARKAGARVVQELHDTDYGSRDFAVRDPEGVYWNFGTYAGA
jgi:uncharacterized glyoxalase superfamily protein PhnB